MAGVQKEIWQRTIVEGFFADDSFMSKAVNDDIYVKEGKTVHIPNAGAPSNVTINRTELPAKVKVRNDKTVDYDLDELTTDPTLIPNAETIELSYDKRNSVISQDRAYLIERAAQNLLYRWNPSKFISTTGKAVQAHLSAATGNRKAFTKEDVLALMTQFNMDNIPQTGRYLLVDAIMYAQLLESLTKTDEIGFFAAADVKKGVVGNLYGFNVMQRSQVLKAGEDGALKKFDVAGAATDVAAALAWHEQSVSRALGEVKMFSDMDSATYYGDLYSFLVRCGGAIRRSDGKGVYRVIQAASA